MCSNMMYISVYTNTNRLSANRWVTQRIKIMKLGTWQFKKMGLQHVCFTFHFIHLNMWIILPFDLSSNLSQRISEVRPVNPQTLANIRKIRTNTPRIAAM